MPDPAPEPTALAPLFDHTLLRIGATEDDVREQALLARKLGVAGFCIAPGWVSLARDLLAASPVAVVTVVAFPHGAATTAVKVFETQDAVVRGADEIDVVTDLGRLRAGAYDAAGEDLAEVVRAAAPRPVKAILETAILDADGMRRAAEMAERAGARFVKTSTGFGPGGATPAAVATLREAVGDRLGVKASGGIRTLAEARAMLAAGASRLGASATASILA